MCLSKSPKMQAPPPIPVQAPAVVQEPAKPAPVFGSSDKEIKKTSAKKKGTSSFQINLQGVEGAEALNIPK